MQVLKLVYIAHGWTLGLLGRPLIKDEVQAWEYGPVIPRLYGAMRHFKSNPVEGPLRGADANEHLAASEASIVDQVYDKYGAHSGPALSRLTHLPGSPWDITYRPGLFGVVIPNDVIEDHYARMATARSGLQP
jgi:uncharacterized phage-associated protein